MKTIIEKVKSIFSLHINNEESVECNYSDNYYGDQYCQSTL